MCDIFVFAVGKTSLITRFMYDSFDNTYQVNFYMMELSVISVLKCVNICHRC